MSRRIHPRAALVLAAALLAATAMLLALHDGAADASSTQVLRISASGSGMLKFNTTRLHAHAGRIEIIMSDPSSAGTSHGIAISGHGVKKVSKIVAPGHSASVTATLKRGTYTFYCPVPGHAQAGMRGTLTVS